MMNLLAFSLAGLCIYEFYKFVRWMIGKAEEQEKGLTTTVGGEVHFQEYNLFDKGDQ